MEFVDLLKMCFKVHVFWIKQKAKKKKKQLYLHVNYKMRICEICDVVCIGITFQSIGTVKECVCA